MCRSEWNRFNLTRKVLTFELKATPKPKNRRVEIKSNPCCCSSSAKLSHNNSSAWGEDPCNTRTAFQRSASDRPNLTRNQMMLESAKRCRDTSFMKALYNFFFLLVLSVERMNEWTNMWADAVRIRWDIIWHKTLMYICTQTEQSTVFRTSDVCLILMALRLLHLTLCQPTSTSAHTHTHRHRGQVPH